MSGGMSCNVAFSRKSDVVIREDISVGEYFYRISSENNKLTKDNIKFKESNIELKESVKELQNKFNVMEKQLQEVNSQSQWVDVPLDDTKPFDKNCEYRAKMLLNDSRVTIQKGEFYTSVVSDKTLIFAFPFDHNTAPVYAIYGRIDYENKNVEKRITGTVFKLEKRCHF